MAGKWVRVSPKLHINQAEKRIRFDSGLDPDDQMVLNGYIAQGFIPVKKVTRKSTSKVRKEAYYKEHLTDKQFEAFKKQAEEESYIVAAHAANKILDKK